MASPSQAGRKEKSASSMEVATTATETTTRGNRVSSSVTKGPHSVPSFLVKNPRVNWIVGIYRAMRGSSLMGLKGRWLASTRFEDQPAKQASMMTLGWTIEDGIEPYIGDRANWETL